MLNYCLVSNINGACPLRFLNTLISIIYAIPSVRSLSFLAPRKTHEVVQSEKSPKLNPSADTNIIELTWILKGKTIRVLRKYILF